MAAIYWLIAFVVLVGIEIMTTALTTIWFAGGAALAFVAALFGAAVAVQLLVFVVISFILLFLTRPLAIKYINTSTVKTNAESLIGKDARSNRRSQQHKRDRNGFCCRGRSGPHAQKKTVRCTRREPESGSVRSRV